MCDLQMGVEEMVERTSGQGGSRSVRELLHSPVLQSGLFIVEEYATVLDGRLVMGTPGVRDKYIVVGSGRNVGPPGGGSQSYQHRIGPQTKEEI